MVMMMALSPTGVHESVIREMEAVCSFVYVSYTGTLAQWQAFLANPLNLPTTLSNAKIQFEYGRGMGIRSSRFELLVPASAAEMRIDASSVLMLKYSYMRDRDRTVWDLGGVYLADNEQEQKWIGLVRRPKPSTNMPQDTRESWQKMITGAHPWEDAPYTYNNGSARTEINSMVNLKDVAAGKASVGYTMTLNSDGVQTSYRMKSDFHALERGFKDFE
jgi:hypothetical protein